MHFIVTMVKQQWIISHRSQRRAPSLTVRDRVVLGLTTLFVYPRRLAKLGVLVKPATLLKFHRALVARKYRWLFSATGRQTARTKQGEFTRSILFGMTSPLFPLQYLIAAFGVWLNRQQQDVIDYLKEENQLLRAKLDGRKIQFTDAERFVRSIKEECMRRMIFFGEASLRRAIKEHMAHYHDERNHQGMNNLRLNVAANDDAYRNGTLSKRARLGGILNYYYREAA